MSQIGKFNSVVSVNSITGNAGGSVSGDAFGDLTLVGDGLTVNIVGTPLTNTLTVSALATVATSYLTDDANSAIAALNILTVAGGTNIGTTSGGSTVTINLDDAITLTTVNATTFDTNVAAAGLTLTGTTLSADGTDANIDINITAKGTGQVIIDDLNISGLTAGTLRSGAGGDISSLADGVDGMLLIGKTGDVPIWAALTDGNNITSTEGANSISIAVTGTTDHTVQVGSAAGALTSLAVGGTGTILTGVAGADPAWTTATYPETVFIGDVLVASANDVVGVETGATTAGYVLTANGAGAAPTFQANPVFDMTWSAEAGTTVAAVANYGYITQNVALTTLTLPAAAALGTTIAIIGEGAGMWTIAQRAGQSIRYVGMASTVGVGGSVSATNQYDTVYIVCRVADTTWSVVSATGVLDVI